MSAASQSLATPPSRAAVAPEAAPTGAPGAAPLELDAPCRFCGAALPVPFLDLGMAPLANRYLRPEQRYEMEPFFPLQLHRCGACSLVQLRMFETPENIFGDYAYFSSYSTSWLAHARRYALAVADRFRLGGESLVVEIASNDGYLLRNFVELGVPVLGVEPARNVAEVAQAAGIPSVVEFFGRKTAAALLEAGHAADLLLGNNVLAHVPDLNDFVGGMKLLLKPGGVITMEFPHLQQLVDHNQFDTVYHEHFSYFSFIAVERVFAAHGLTLWDVDELPTHGGSLRIYGRHAADNSKPVSDRVHALRARELAAGYDGPELYEAFARRVREIRSKLLEFCFAARRTGRTVVGYGAPAKGNTLLSYCGINRDLVEYTVDRSPHKQGLFLPGTHIPIYGPEKIAETRPDYVLVLPWNLQEEITEQLAYIREWGGRFVVPIPEPRVLA
jgi:SAM-dependent methyltransferase